MKKCLLSTVLALVSVLIFSCQYVPEEKAETPSPSGIKGIIIIAGMEDLSMCSIIAERQINGRTVSVIKEIGSGKAAPEPPVGYHDQMQIFDNKQIPPIDPVSGEILLEKSSDEHVFSTVSDINGNFELMDLPEGLYTVTASNEHTLGSVSTDVLVNAQAVTEIVIVLTATGSISGTVQLDSDTEALQGTFVYAEGTSYIAGTGFSGNFTIKNIPTGVYDIIFYHDGYTSAETVGVIVNAASDTPLDMVNLSYIGNFPVISTVTADPVVVEPGTTVTLSASASDEDGDDLTYTWTSGYGTFVSDTGNPVTWIATEEEVSCKITVTVSDGVNETTGDVIVVVVATGILEGNAWRGDFTVEDTYDLEFISHYDRVIGDLIIKSTQFTDLNFLENLTMVDGSLYIEQNSLLTSISGLNSLTSVGGDLKIYDNDKLEDLDGLASLTTIGGSLSIDKNLLIKDLDGLGSVVSIGGGLKVCDNISLKTITSLTNITFLNGDLDISDNEVLENLSGLTNITAVEGLLKLYNNNSLVNLDGLDGITTVTGNILIMSNDLLDNLEGLTNITHVNSDLNITSNNILKDLKGLRNINTVKGNLGITNNDSLTDLDGMEGITTLEGALCIMDNNGLIEINALSNVTSIGGDLWINWNDLLENLSGLINLITIDGDLYIQYNQSLPKSDAEALIEQLVYFTGDWDFTGNKED